MSSDGTVLLTVLLKHDQSQNLDQIQSTDRKSVV